MTLNEFYNEVARNADTEKTQIGAAETKRVLSEAFKILAAMSTADALDTLSKGIATAKKKLAAS